MSAIPCGVCKQRKPGKLASAYWAWFDQDGGRIGWKMRTCAECAPVSLGLLLAPQSDLGSGGNPNCTSCGASTTDDPAFVYCTLYLPKQEPSEYAVPLCEVCAGPHKEQIRSASSPLPDREGVVRGPSPATSAWDALGLAPS